MYAARLIVGIVQNDRDLARIRCAPCSNPAWITYPDDTRLQTPAVDLHFSSSGSASWPARCTSLDMLSTEGFLRMQSKDSAIFRCGAFSVKVLRYRQDLVLCMNFKDFLRLSSKDRSLMPPCCVSARRKIVPRQIVLSDLCRPNARIGILLIGLDFVFTPQPRSADILVFFSRSGNAFQSALISSSEHGEGLKYGLLYRDYS